MPLKIEFKSINPKDLKVGLMIKFTYREYSFHDFCTIKKIKEIEGKKYLFFDHSPEVDYDCEYISDLKCATPVIDEEELNKLIEDNYTATAAHSEFDDDFDNECVISKQGFTTAVKEIISKLIEGK